MLEPFFILLETLTRTRLPLPYQSCRARIMIHLQPAKAAIDHAHSTLAQRQQLPQVLSTHATIALLTATLPALVHDRFVEDVVTKGTRRATATTVGDVGSQAIVRPLANSLN